MFSPQSNGTCKSGHSVTNVKQARPSPFVGSRYFKNRKHLVSMQKQNFCMPVGTPVGTRY